MAVLPGEIIMYLSGGGANSDPDASLGGAISSTAFTTATLENLFSNISSAEATAGSTKYRCVYIRNTSGTSDLVNGGKYISQESPSSDTQIDLGLGTSGISGTEQTVADEDTAPSSVTFSHPTTEGAKLSFGGTLTPNDYVPIWIRRTVSPGATATALDNPITVVTGETA
jgi:hypothetical protein